MVPAPGRLDANARLTLVDGEARPVRDIQVAAPATGVRILQILVDEGDTVTLGDVTLTAHVLPGHMMSDVVSILGSFDFVMGECDR